MVDYTTDVQNDISNFQAGPSLSMTIKYTGNEATLVAASPELGLMGPEGSAKPTFEPTPGLG